MDIAKLRIKKNRGGRSVFSLIIHNFALQPSLAGDTGVFMVRKDDIGMSYTINVRGRLVSLATPKVMGILNATPDSFYAGSRTTAESDIARRADEIVVQGGEIIDVGAFSTRPGAEEVSADEEWARLRRALAIVRRAQPDVTVSVDTFRPEVARRCVEEGGADIINDVSEGGITGIVGRPAGVAESMFRTVAELHVPYILMSVRADIDAMIRSFAEETQQLFALGAADIILDPGFGFGKTTAQNYAVMARMERLKAFRLPVLVGISRKSMIYKVAGGDPDEALDGTTALHAVALAKGAKVLRVHDVAAAVQAVRVMTALKKNS